MSHPGIPHPPQSEVNFGPAVPPRRLPLPAAKVVVGPASGGGSSSKIRSSSAAAAAAQRGDHTASAVRGSDDAFPGDRPGPYTASAAAAASSSTSSANVLYEQTGQSRVLYSADTLDSGVGWGGVGGVASAVDAECISKTAL